MDSKRKAIFGSQDQPKKVQKKNSNDEEFERSNFEEELALMDEMEDEFRSQSLESQECSAEDIESEPSNVKWARPQSPALNPSQDPVIFQQLDLDYYVGQPVPGMPGCNVGPVPIVRMFGVTMAGNSVLCHVHGFLPYFFIPAPPDFQKADCALFREVLNNIVIADMKSNKENISDAVLSVELVMKENIYGYTNNGKVPFLKVTVLLPRFLPAAKRLLET
ncbi:DNA polymerase delta catalytic subunit, partial [Stegodyphus mimosarum]